MNEQAASSRTAIVAFVVVTAIFAIFVYMRTGVEDVPGDYHVRKGNYRLEDGQYGDAIAEFELALGESPRHREAHFGMAVTYLRMDRLEDAAAKLGEVIEIDPAFGPAWANRGIVHDRLGRLEAAIADYRRAVEIDPELTEGPGWIWRFLRNISEKPPTIADRADYLEAELAKPPEERLLAVPEEDAKQRMYKVE